MQSIYRTGSSQDYINTEATAKGRRNIAFPKFKMGLLMGDLCASKCDSEIGAYPSLDV